MIEITAGLPDGNGFPDFSLPDQISGIKAALLHDDFHDSPERFSRRRRKRVSSGQKAAVNPAGQRNELAGPEVWKLSAVQRLQGYLCGIVPCFFLFRDHGLEHARMQCSGQLVDRIIRYGKSIGAFIDQLPPLCCHGKEALYIFPGVFASLKDHVSLPPSPCPLVFFRLRLLRIYNCSDTPAVFLRSRRRS